MITKRILISLLISLFLISCSSTEIKIESISPLLNSEVCCSHFSQFPWIELNSADEVNFAIDSDSPIGQFSDGNSYFSAFSFSTRSMKVQLKLSSLMTNNSVIAPKLIMLNPNFEVVRTVNLDEFSIVTSSAFSASQFQLNIEIDASKAPYFIIYSPDQYLGQVIKVKHPARVRAEEFGEVMPMVTDPSYTYERFGSLKLNVNTLSLRPQQLMTAPRTKEILLQTTSQALETSALPETESFYKQSMTDAIKHNDFDKALSLLEEAKKVGIKDAQSIFIKLLESTNNLTTSGEHCE